MAAIASLPALWRSQPRRNPQFAQCNHHAVSTHHVSFSLYKERQRAAGPKLLKIQTRWDEKRSIVLRASSSDDVPPSGNVPILQSPSDVITQLYVSINNKDMKMLDGCFSSDCVLEDLTFSKPFQGSKEIKGFLKDLMAAMGDDVRFVLHDMNESDLTATVLWHLEWKGKTIPCSRGCSFIECERGGQISVIKKGRIITESPFKPGRFAIGFLKVVAYMFDNFPNLADRFLQKPYAAIQFVTKIYKMFLEPFILPLIIYYSQVWKFAADTLKYLINLVLRMLKNFF